MSREHATRSKTDSERDEHLIQRVVENLLISEPFLNKLCEAVSKTVRREIEQTIQGYEAKVESLQSELLEAKLKIDNLNEKMDWNARSKNLRIYGVPDNLGENTSAVMVDLITNKMKCDISNNDVSDCFRLGKYDNNKPRAIVVKFVRKQKREDVFSKKKNLKGTRITVREDLTAQRLNILKTAINKCGNKNVWTTNGIVMVKCNTIIHKILNLSDLDKF